MKLKRCKNENEITLFYIDLMLSPHFCDFFYYYIFLCCIDIQHFLQSTIQDDMKRTNEYRVLDRWKWFLIQKRIFFMFNQILYVQRLVGRRREEWGERRIKIMWNVRVRRKRTEYSYSEKWKARSWSVSLRRDLKFKKYK